MNTRFNSYVPANETTDCTRVDRSPKSQTRATSRRAELDAKFEAIRDAIRAGNNPAALDLPWAQEREPVSTRVMSDDCYLNMLRGALSA